MILERLSSSLIHIWPWYVVLLPLYPPCFQNFPKIFLIFPPAYNYGVESRHQLTLLVWYLSSHFHFIQWFDHKIGVFRSLEVGPKFGLQLTPGLELILTCLNTRSDFWCDKHLLKGIVCVCVRTYVRMYVRMSHFFTYLQSAHLWRHHDLLVHHSALRSCFNDIFAAFFSSYKISDPQIQYQWVQFLLHLFGLVSSTYQTSTVSLSVRPFVISDTKSQSFFIRIGLRHFSTFIIG